MIRLACLIKTGHREPYDANKCVTLTGIPGHVREYDYVYRPVCIPKILWNCCFHWTSFLGLACDHTSVKILKCFENFPHSFHQKSTVLIIILNHNSLKVTICENFWKFQILAFRKQALKCCKLILWSESCIIFNPLTHERM